MTQNHSRVWRPLNEDERKKLEGYLRGQSANVELEDLHWVHGDDEAVPYCYECAVKKVEEIKSREPESDVCVDGGWGTEEDGPESCDTCGKPLYCSFTYYGSESEVDHFIENGFDHLNAYDCHCLETAISSRGWDVWSEMTYRNNTEKEENYNYFEKLHNLCRKILSQISVPSVPSVAEKLINNK